MVGRLDRLRKEVADRGIIPRREGTEGLPSAVYCLRVAELDHLIQHPEEAPEYIERAKHRSRKRRRSKYLREKAFQGPEAPSGHGARVAAVLEGDAVRCLGSFVHTERFVSATGFARAKHGYVYEVERSGVAERVALSESEGDFAWVNLGVRRVHSRYPGTDLDAILWKGYDKAYRPLLEEQ